MYSYIELKGVSCWEARSPSWQFVVLFAAHALEHLHRIFSGYGVHHLASGVELLQQAVHFLNLGARAQSEALATVAAVATGEQHFGVLALVWCH